MYSQSQSRSLHAKPDDDANGFAAAGNAVHVTRTDKSCVLVSMIRLQAEVVPPELLLFCRCANVEYPPFSPKGSKVCRI